MKVIGKLIDFYADGSIRKETESLGTITKKKVYEIPNLSGPDMTAEVWVFKPLYLHYSNWFKEIYNVILWNEEDLKRFIVKIISE